VARALQANDRCVLRERIEKPGKCALDETGKYLVNRNDEGTLAIVSIRGTLKSLSSWLGIAVRRTASLLLA
jgi:hypothetical protein